MARPGQPFWDSKKHMGGYFGPDGTTLNYDQTVPPPAGTPDAIAWAKLGRNTMGGQAVMADEESAKVLDLAAKWRAANKVLGARDAAKAKDMNMWMGPPDARHTGGFINDTMEALRTHGASLFYTPEQQSAFVTLNGALAALQNVRTLPRGGTNTEFKELLRGASPTGDTPSDVTDDRIDRVEQEALYARAVNKAIRDGKPLPTELPPPATPRIDSKPASNVPLVPGAYYEGPIYSKPSSDATPTPTAAPVPPTGPAPQPPTPVTPAPAQQAAAQPNALRQLLGVGGPPVAPA